MALNLVWFLWVARSYEYKEIEHPRRAHPAQQKPSGQVEPQWMQPQNGHGMQAAHVSGCCCVAAAQQTGLGMHLVTQAHVLLSIFAPSVVCDTCRRSTLHRASTPQTRASMAEV